MCRHVQTRVVHPDLVQKTLLPEAVILWQFWTSSRSPLNPSDFKTLGEISRASAIVVDWAVLRQCCASLAASCETSRLVGPTRVLRYRVGTWGTIYVSTHLLGGDEITSFVWVGNGSLMRSLIVEMRSFCTSLAASWLKQIRCWSLFMWLYVGVLWYNLSSVFLVSHHPTVIQLS